MSPDKIDFPLSYRQDFINLTYKCWCEFISSNCTNVTFLFFGNIMLQRNCLFSCYCSVVSSSYMLTPFQFLVLFHFSLGVFFSFKKGWTEISLPKTQLFSNPLKPPGVLHLSADVYLLDWVVFILRVRILPNWWLSSYTKLYICWSTNIHFLTKTQYEFHQKMLPRKT